jgi:transposase InsO family protein
MMIRLFKRAQKQGYTLDAKPIHHSDRGVQYCCADYIRLIDHYGFLPSMTQSGEPTDNALAERVIMVRSKKNSRSIPHSKASKLYNKPFPNPF